MSFSQDTKQELSKINNLAKKDEVKLELIGYLISCNTTIIKGNNLRYSTENEYNINRFAKLLNNLNIHYSIEMEGKLFVIKFIFKDDNYVKIEDKKIIINNEYISDESTKKTETTATNNRIIKDEEIKILVRGVFLGGGSINNPENKYHLELKFSNENNANVIKNILQNFYINFKTLYKENKYSLYLKMGKKYQIF